MARAFIGLGSNEGDRLENISRAAKLLGDCRGIQLVRMATILEYEPVGGPPQGPYLNTVLEVETTLTPRQLLTEAKRIEEALGRKLPGERWGPRPIDLDILLIEDLVLAEPDLMVPHPRLHERGFVLEPLSQLDPELTHPVLKKTVDELRAAVPPGRVA
jgi:2-amino-4-hydroxy-6-hydroxymethyldihydropteridine diphosphokinase